MATGFILGKFIPLHTGHEFLFETALKEVDTLCVIIYDNKAFAIPLDVRVNWLHHIYPALVIIPVTELYHQDFTASETWANHHQLLKAKLPADVTHFFSSENHSYYQLLADHLNVRHHIVDKERVHVSIRGSDIMHDPQKYDAFLHPYVREYFTLNKTSADI